MMRAKLELVCFDVQEFANGKTVKARFAARYDTSIPEDQRFQKATPWGECVLQIDNPAVLEQLKPGTSFYIDFTPVPKTEAPKT